MLKRLLNPKREEGRFTNVRDRDARARRTVVVTILAATAVMGWLYVLFGSGLFRVTQVDAGELVNLDRGEVEQQALAAMDDQGRLPWQWRNVLLLDTNRLAIDLQKRLYAEHVTVEKSYPNVLRLKIEERQSSVIVIANNEFYLVDRNGIGTQRISDEDQAKVLQRIAKPSTTLHTDVPILTIRQDAVFTQGEAFTDAQTVQEWLQAFHDLTEAGFGYRNAILERPTSTKLILNLFEPYDVYMDLLAPIPPQIDSYYTFMKAKTPAMKINQYVDVRVPGKVFYQ
jgi:hypothetical protein